PLPISPPLRLFASDARCASNAMGFGLNKLPRAADRTGRNVCGHEIPRACLGIVRQSLKPGLAFSRPKHVAAKLGYPARPGGYRKGSGGTREWRWRRCRIELDRFQST